MSVSFAAKVKAEICRGVPSKKCCALAECFGILLFCNSFSQDMIRIITESREFAHGIPGTVGGGVYMNAGAYGGEICQVCTCVDVMDFQGNVTTLSCEEMEFSYRHSVLEERGGIVVFADFKLTPMEPQSIRDKMKELMGKRSASQPLDKPSAGSAFKRPVGGYAAALIDQAGLKGFRVGGAAISEKHAGFAVNLGGATAADVRTLLDRVSDIVYEKSGIRLEPEVRIW